MEKSETLRLGRFICEELLGSGGVTETFRARLNDLRGLERPFAVKLLRPDRGGDNPQVVARFVAAGRKAQLLSDPGIVRVVEVSDKPGAVYVASEFVDGTDLRRLLEDAQDGGAKGVDPSLVVHIGCDAFQTLEAAHTALDPVLHLGLAPGNVMLTTSGEVRLLDFGAAAAVRDKANDDVSRWLYVAPEIMAQGEGTVASDIYSLGACLFELLAGRPPIGADTMEELERKLKSPIVSYAGVPEALAKVLKSLLAAKPADRPPSAQAAAEALAGAIGKRQRLSEVMSASGINAAVGAAAPAPSAPVSASPPAVTPPGGHALGTVPLLRREVARGPVEEVQEVVFEPGTPTNAAASGVAGAAAALDGWTMPTGVGKGGFEAASLSQYAAAPNFAGLGSAGKAAKVANVANVANVAQPAPVQLDVQGDLVVEVLPDDAPEVPAFNLEGGSAISTPGTGVIPSFGDSFFDVPSNTAAPPGTNEPELNFDDGIVRSDTPDVSEFLSANPGLALEEGDLKGEPVQSVRAARPQVARANLSSSAPPMPSPASRLTAVQLAARSARMDRPSMVSRISPATPLGDVPPLWARKSFIGGVVAVAVLGGVAAAWQMGVLPLPIPGGPAPSPTAGVAPPVATPKTEAAKVAKKAPPQAKSSPAAVVAANPPANGKASPKGSVKEAPAKDEPVVEEQPEGLPVKLKPGLVEIYSRPVGAAVWLDGEKKGKTPYKAEVEPGAHRVVLTLDGYQLVREVIDAGEGAVLRRTLEPGFKPPFGDAGIKVRCVTEGAYHVFIDGKDTGRVCPTERIDVAPGAHEVGIFVPKTRELYTTKQDFEPSRSSTRVYFKY